MDEIDLIIRQTLSNIFIILSTQKCREAVRQRKALSRTSSKILLNSIQIGHRSNQFHQLSPSNHPSECYLSSMYDDLKEDNCQHSESNIEVRISLQC